LFFNSVFNQVDESLREDPAPKTKILTTSVTHVNSNICGFEDFNAVVEADGFRCCTAGGCSMVERV